jgi:hypothetical protein
MKKFAVISFAALVLALAGAFSALAVEPMPIVKAPPQGQTGPDYDPCTLQPPCEAIPPQPVGRYPPGFPPPGQKKDDPAQAVDRLPIVKVSPPGATAQKNVSPGTRRLPCSTCDRRPPVGRYPPGYTPPASKKKDDLPLPASTSDYQPPVGRYPPGVAPPAQPVDDAPPAEPVVK